MSVVRFTQNLFHQGNYCRDISLNATYIFVLKNMRDRDQFSHLTRPLDSKGLSDADLHATKAAHD